MTRAFCLAWLVLWCSATVYFLVLWVRSTWSLHKIKRELRATERRLRMARADLLAAIIDRAHAQ